MKKIKHYHRRFKLCFLEAAAITLAVCAFLVPSIQLIKHTGNNYFTVKLNGVEVGHVGAEENLEDLLVQARRQVVADSGSDELILIRIWKQLEANDSGHRSTMRKR